MCFILPPVLQEKSNLHLQPGLSELHPQGWAANPAHAWWFIHRRSFATFATTNCTRRTV